MRVHPWSGRLGRIALVLVIVGAFAGTALFVAARGRAVALTGWGLLLTVGGPLAAIRLSILSMIGGALERRRGGESSRVASTAALVGALIWIVVGPAALRTRSPGEPGGVGELRTLQAAEKAFRSLSGGTFGEPECLANPEACVPGGGTVPLIDSGLVGPGARLGYEIAFHPGPAPLPK